MAYTQGFKVYTTIHSDLQLAANQLTEKHLIAYDHRHGYRGAIRRIPFHERTPKKELLSALRAYESVNDLQPGIVIAVREKSLHVLLQDEQVILIPWNGLTWARRHSAYEIAKTGDIIYVKHEQTGWQLSQIPKVEAALFSMNPQNGAIEALVGGFNYQNSKFNRVTQSQRQPGSSFKPFIYAAALNKGYSLASLVNDSPIVINDTGQASKLWRPHNDNNTFNGPTRIREALAKSRNLVSIRLLDNIGIDYAIQFVTRFGFEKNQLPHALSLALGSLSVSPLELTSAYAIIANGGYRVEPYLIDRITSRHGEVLLQANPSQVCQLLEHPQAGKNCAPQVIPSDLAFLIHSALQSVIEHGTASSARVLERHDLAGKTGTTNEQVDAWFAGYHPQLVTTTWFGYDNPKPLHEYAAALALPLWIDYMRVALKHLPEQIIQPPSGIVTIPINPSTGLKAYKNTPQSIEEYFRTDEIPNEDDAAAATTLDSSAPATTQESQEDLF